MATQCPVCSTTSTRTMFEKDGCRFLRCGSGCEIAWVDPLPTATELAQYYDQEYGDGTYSEFAQAGEVREWIARERFEAFRPFVGNGRWLEIGCSTGSFMAVARDAGVTIEGIDISPGAVAAAAARQLHASASSVEDYRPANRFDTVCAFDVLEHLLDPGAFLRRTHDWIVPGGHLHLTVPNLRSVFPRLLMGRHWFYFVPNEHLFYFGPRGLRALLDLHGFDVVHLARAFKPLTLEYAAGVLDYHAPPFGDWARRLLRLLPPGARTRRWRIYIGEMMAVARRRETS